MSFTSGTILDLYISPLIFPYLKLSEFIVSCNIFLNFSLLNRLSGRQFNPTALFLKIFFTASSTSLCEKSTRSSILALSSLLPLFITNYSLTSWTILTLNFTVVDIKISDNINNQSSLIDLRHKNN